MFEGKHNLLGGGVTGVVGYCTNTLPSGLRSRLEFQFKLSILAGKMLKPKKKMMHVKTQINLLKYFVTRKMQKHVYQRILSTWVKGLTDAMI